MYIDNEERNFVRPDSSAADGVSAAETSTWMPPEDNSPGSAPISPETPSWGPPSDNSPGFAPISPETPSWGPPSDNSPGFAPISPETPSWGPPSGGTSIPPVIIVPGQSVTPNGSSGQYANIRFLHAAANQPAVTVRLGNRTVINNMQFGNSTPYYLDTANQRTQITVTNAQTGATLYRGVFTFASQTAYTVTIVNSCSGISLYALTDTPCNRTNYGCLRAVNLSPNSGPVDVFLSGYGRIFQSVDQFAYTEYRLISQGTYRAMVSETLPCSNNSSIVMTETYVECSNTRIAIMDSATFNIMNGVTYTLYIIGLAYQFPALQILPLESDLVY